MFKLPLDSNTHLQILERHHAEPLFEVVNSSREYLRKWLPWVDHTTSTNDVKAFIDRSLSQFAAYNGFQVGIWHKDQIVGCLGYHPIQWGNKTTSLGYWIGEPFQGHGHMTSACRALVTHAFKEYGLNRVEIRCASENKKSRAVPEQLGFTHEGTLRQAEHLSDGRIVDHELYAILASEWPVK